MKKILAFTLLLSFFVGNFGGKVLAEDQKYFVVTAYYSPLPNQQNYLTGDYESEKNLNGEGIKGASGKSVFSGMLAAPKTYSFGTKIYLEGLGIGEVADRGGAIVTAGNRGYSYDRIDVWVGYGDEGLKRALYWGKRTVKGNFVSNNSNITLNFNNIPAPSWATKGLNNVSSIFSNSLGKGSDTSMVKNLQEILSEVGLYKGKIDGIYNSQVVDIVYNFQLDNDIIKNSSDFGAGYWGKMTRASFLKKYLDGEFDSTNKIQENNTIKTQNVTTNPITTKNSSTNNSNTSDLSIFNNTVNDGEPVKILQKKLVELGIYKGEITGKYCDIVDEIYDYQISNGIITGLSTPGAGSFGPKTRDSLKQLYIKYIETIKEKQAQENRKKELEEKYKKLEELSLQKAQERLSIVGTPKFGEVSSGVRELQVILKELGHFTVKDTAIYGDTTKKSIISYQKSKNLIRCESDLGAGMIGPITLGAIKKDLKDRYLTEIIKKENISKEEIAIITGGKI